MLRMMTMIMMTNNPSLPRDKGSCAPDEPFDLSRCAL